jgi:alginate biosynthesis protein Alg44
MTTVDHLNQERERTYAANGFGTAEQRPDLIEDNEHPFIQLPFSVGMDGRSYEGTAISMVGARVAGLANRHLVGLSKFAAFRFNFDGFSIAIPIEVKVTSESLETGQLTLKFCEPTGPHMPHLRYILNSWLAGDYVHMNGVIDAPRKSASVARAPGAQRVRQAGRFRRLLGALLVASASLVLALVAANALGKRIFIAEVAGVSIVDKSTTPLKATVGGQLAFVDRHAAMGKPAYSILASNGGSVTVAMPCDCVIDKSVENGSTVSPGETLMLLSKKDAAPIVRSNFDASDLRLLAAGAIPKIDLPSGEAVPARAEIDRFALSAGQNAASTIAVSLLPTRPIDDALIGRPVNVRLDSTPAWITAAVRRVKSSRLFAAEVAP